MSIRTLRVVLLGIILSSCDATAPAGNEGAGGISPPARLRAVDRDSLVLRGIVNGESFESRAAGPVPGTWSFVRNLSPDRQVTLSLVWVDSRQGDLILAELPAGTTYPAPVRGGSYTIGGSDYIYPNDDGDQLDNIAEMVCGTDPRIFDDSGFLAGVCGTGDGSVPVDPLDTSAIAGAYDSSFLFDDGSFDQVYVVIGPDGRFTSHDFLGDDVDFGPNCHVSREGTVQRISQGTYSFDPVFPFFEERYDVFVFDDEFDGGLELFGLEFGELLIMFRLEGLTNADFNAC